LASAKTSSGPQTSRDWTPEKATKATVLTWLRTSLNGRRCDSVNGLVAVEVFMEILLWRVSANAVSHERTAAVSNTLAMLHW
jgi:hypothetical protein